MKSGLLYCVVFLLFAGCASSPPRAKEYARGDHKTVLARWTGRYLHGRPTASGEIYNMFGLFAAHNRIPFGSLLRVSDPASGRSVEVVVNDRTPRKDDGVLHLSYGAAKQLNLIESESAKVEFEIIGQAPISRPSRPKRQDQAESAYTYFVQIGSFQNRENALRLKERVSKWGEHPFVETYETSEIRVFRVRLGPYASEEEAMAAVLALRRQLSNDDPISPIVVENY